MEFYGSIGFNWSILQSGNVHESTVILPTCSCIAHVFPFFHGDGPSTIQGQHCHLCPPGALQKRKRRNRELVKVLRQGQVPSCQMDPVDPSTVGSMPLPVVFLAWP